MVTAAAAFLKPLAVAKLLAPGELVALDLSPAASLFSPWVHAAITPQPEVGNVTSKRNGVTRYRLCHILRAITFCSDNASNLDRAITLSRDNGSYVPRAITFRNDNFAVL
jgi:hypothetical protein